MKHCGSVELHPLSSALGAEVVGVDAREPLSSAVAAELQRCYDEFHLLVFRNQYVDEAQQERFVATFGPPIDDMADGRLTGPISNVMDDKAGSGPLPFHADYSFTPLPVQGIVLYAMLEYCVSVEKTFVVKPLSAATSVKNWLIVDS